MTKRILTVNSRPLSTKHSVKAMRKEGMVPGVLYGKKIGSIPVAVLEKDLRKVSGAHLLEIVLPQASYPAVIREIQKDSLNGALRHVDFQQVDLTEKMKADVAVHLTGTPLGEKAGGILQPGERSIGLEALPAEMPGFVEADVTNLEIGDSFTAADLQKALPYKILSDLQTVLARVVPPAADLQPEEIINTEDKPEENDVPVK